MPTFGSRGDNEPFAALAASAAAAGHEVVFAHTSDIPRVPGASYEQWDLPGSLRELFGPQGVSLWRGVREYRQVFKPLLESIYEASSEHIRRLSPDVVVYHPKVLTAPVIAREVGALAVAAELAPTLTPTREFPPAGIPWTLPAGLNKASYGLISLGLAAFGSRAKKLAAEKGLPSHLPHLTLCPVSPSIVPQPADWPDSALITGQWHLSDPGPVDSDNELDAFLEHREVAYAGFGSMKNGDGRRRAEVIVSAARALGMPVLLVTGWGGLEPSDAMRDAEDVLIRESVNHASVLPRVSVALHHGGAGTTHAMLRAGVPSVVMPFLGDQPWWAARLANQGLGPAAVHRNTRKPEVVTRAIEAARAARERVIEISKSMAEEAGTDVAVAAIETARARF